MSFSHAGWWSTAVAVLVFVILTGCDVPTGNPSPSVNTETSINTPLVSDKTFTFLGSPDSEFDPLIDTTSSEFDSLFTVDSESNDISIVQEIDDLDIGSLEGALDNAAGDLAVSNTFEETLIGNGDLITQEVSTDFDEANRTFKSGDLPSFPVPAPNSGSSGIYDGYEDDNDEASDVIALDFPSPSASVAETIPAPQFGAVDATGATILSVTPTSLDSDDEGTLNEITFTLSNPLGNDDLTCNDSSSETTCASGEAPVIVVEGVNGSSSNQKSFGTGPLEGGSSESATVDVSNLTLGKDGQGKTAQYRLFVKGTNSGNQANLEVDLTRFEYQEATVSDPQNVEISASTTGLDVVGGDSNFEALTAGEGQTSDESKLALEVVRGNSGLGDFDTSIDTATIKNVEIPDFAPDDFDDFLVDVDDLGGTSIDLANRDLAKGIDINDLTASPEQSNEPLTFSADDVYTISIDGTVRIQTLYFRPDGETVRTQGTVSVESDKVDIQSGDLVEITDAMIETEQLDLQPDIAFDTLAFTYPDLRRGPDFQKKDSLQVRFVQDGYQDSPFEFNADQLQDEGFEVTLDENLQIRPETKNTVKFRASGKLVDADDPDVTGSEATATASAGDGITATTTISDFGIQKIDVSKSNAFRVDVTTDENDDGELDLTDDAEAETSSFDGFESVSSQVDGLELDDVSLDFSISTRNLTKTKANLYTAIQGKNETESKFLTGEQVDDGVLPVSSTDLAPFETRIVNGSSPISEGSLIGFEVDRKGANLGETVDPPPLTIDDGNSNVSDFVNTLPTEIRFVGLAEINGDGGALRLQDPIELDAGFTLDVPLKIRERFVLRDTIEEDLSDLEDVTDPEEDVNISTAELQFSYTNGLPLGADVTLKVVDDRGTVIETFEDPEGSNDENYRIEPAPKDDDGAASGTSSGEFVFNLGDTREKLRALADGEEIRLKLNMDQEGSGGGTEAVAQFRADDRLTLDQIRLKVDASISQ